MWFRFGSTKVTVPDWLCWSVLSTAAVMVAAAVRRS